MWSILLMAGSLVGLPARAQVSDPWEQWSVSAGFFLAGLNSEARIGLPGVGTAIDLERGLGLTTSRSAFRADAGYRFGGTRRHRVELSWIDLSRTATRSLYTEIDIGGKRYPVGTLVSSRFDLSFYNVRYSYSFLRDDRVDLAASIGLHVTDLGLLVKSESFGAAGDAVTAPLPLVGGRTDVVLAPRWHLRTSFEVLYLKLSGFEGFLSDLVLTTEYRAWERLAFGAGFNTLRFNLQMEKNTAGLDFTGTVKIDFVGVLLYGKLVI